jgi:hypothetical protein
MTMNAAEIQAQLDLEKRVTKSVLETRFDAGETPYLSRQLLAMKSKLYEIKYSDLVARTLIPVDTTVDPGATKIAYEEVDQFGRAKIIGPNAKVIPRVDVQGTETQTPVVTLAAMYAFEWHEMKAAATAARNGSRISLPERKPKAARRAIDEAIDELLWIGNSDAGITGLANHASVTSTASGANWSTYTAKQIYDVIITALNLIKTDTKGRYGRQNVKIMLPTSEMARIAVMPWGYTIGADPVYNDLTVLKFLQTNLPGVEFVESYMLESVSGSKRMVILTNDEDVIEGQIPLEFEVLPPEQDGLETKYICVARCGGVVVRQPKAMRYVTGL